MNLFLYRRINPKGTCITSLPTQRSHFVLWSHPAGTGTCSRLSDPEVRSLHFQNTNPYVYFVCLWNGVGKDGLASWLVYVDMPAGKPIKRCAKPTSPKPWDFPHQSVIRLSLLSPSLVPHVCSRGALSGPSDGTEMMRWSRAGCAFWPAPGMGGLLVFAERRALHSRL